MRETKKITVSALTVALGVVLMVIGAEFGVLDLTSCALASLLVAFIYIEIGAPYTFLVWICTSLVSAFLYTGSAVWIEYLLIFGIYPILKGYIERLPRIFWLILKLGFVNTVIWLLAFLVELITKVPLFDGETFWFNALIYVIMNVAFVAYDMFITVLVRFYLIKLQPRIKNFLK